jgi:hypothetical protein
MVKREKEYLSLDPKVSVKLVRVVAVEAGAGLVWRICASLCVGRVIESARWCRTTPRGTFDAGGCLVNQ